MSNLIRTVIRLVADGWRPYDAQPRPDVYERLGCPNAQAKPHQRPYWFTRGDVFCCIACPRACSLNRPAGFPPPLPINYPQTGEPFQLSPQELASRKHTLRVDEVAYCLNISERQVYNLVAEGKLVALRDKPVRVRASDVEAMMGDFEE
jgi:excisionase family DNA binding protein